MAARSFHDWILPPAWAADSTPLPPIDYGPYLLNVSIMLWLLLRPGRRLAHA